MANIFDVSQYILHSIGGEISTMKLQKLCYYSQAWHLVWYDKKPLFEEDFEAWNNGTVCRELFNWHKGNFVVSEKMLPKDKLTNSLTVYEGFAIDRIIDFYGSKTGAWLNELVKKEKPWLETKKGKKISKSSMFNYYLSIITLEDYLTLLANRRNNE